MREVGHRPRHALSQNFLADVNVLERILAEAAPEPGRRVLEIGPGLGILTGGLLAAGCRVTAVELDRVLARRLRAVFAGEIDRAGADPAAPGGLRLVEGDILDQDLATLVEPPFDVIANLPYHITSPILHRLLGEAPRPEGLVLMVQREVAERIAAAPGRMSYLSVFVQYHASARIAFLVPAASFEPEPAVDSAVIVLDTRPLERPERLDPAAEDHLWRLVQAAFRERRKMLHNVLSRQLPIDSAGVARALEAAGIDPDRRPQTVTVEEWLRLRDAIGPLPSDRRGRPRQMPDGDPAEADPGRPRPSEPAPQ
jgi:16S rRNA (adenine1518-N6/adenine1519-N6)-dimethyltransferase